MTFQSVTAQPDYSLNQDSSPASSFWSLQQCIDTALAYNRSLAISHNQESISRHREKEVRAARLPTLQVIGEYKYYADLPFQYMPMSAFGGSEEQFRQTQFGVPHNLGLQAQLSMPVYHPQLSGALESSAIASEMASLAHTKTIEEVTYETSLLYYNAQIVLHQISHLDSSLVNTRKLLENLRLLYTHQLARNSDVQKVELQAEQLEIKRNQTANTLEQVMKNLKFTMGADLDALIGVDPEIRLLPPVSYRLHPSVDIQLATTRLELTRSELKTLRNSTLPSLSLMASYGQTGFGYDRKPDDFLNFHPVSFAGIKFSWPLFNGTATRHKIAQKNLDLRNGERQLEMTRDRNVLNLELAESRLTVARQSAESLQKQVELARDVYNSLILQQRQGTANLTEVLLADNAWKEAHQNYLSAVIEYLKSELEFKRMSGNLNAIK